MGRFKTLLQDAAKYTFEKKKKVSNDWFDDNDEEIRQLLEDKRLNRNKLRERITLLKNRWYQVQAEKAERYAEAKNHKSSMLQSTKSMGREAKVPTQCDPKMEHFSRPRRK